MAKKGDLLVGLDIGTSKVCAVIGEVTQEGVDIIGVGMTPSKGLQKGAVTNIEGTAQAVQRAVEEAELMAGCEVSTVYAAISGGHIQGFNSQGITAIPQKEVMPADVARVIEQAKIVAIPEGREILHVIPQEFIIDGQRGIENPLGISGTRLEANVHIVTGASVCAQNIIKCVSRCNLNVSDIILEQIASAEAVLTASEKESGCVLIDIGAGTTDISVWMRNTLIHSSTLSIGGHHITKDISVILRTPLEEAERLKQRHGCASPRFVGAEEMIDIASSAERAARRIPRRGLVEVIEPRVEEIFAMVHHQLEGTGIDPRQFVGGAVITGGCTIMDKMPQVAEEILGIPVQRGLPKGVGGLTDVVKSPKFSTAIGLILYAIRSPEKQLYRAPEERAFQRITRRMKAWFKEIV